MRHVQDQRGNLPGQGLPSGIAEAACRAPKVSRTAGCQSLGPSREAVSDVSSRRLCVVILPCDRNTARIASPVISREYELSTCEIDLSCWVLPSASLVWQYHCNIGLRKPPLSPDVNIGGCISHTPQKQLLETTNLNIGGTS